MMLQKEIWIVVMRGAFNSSAISHLGLLEATIRMIRAQKDSFVSVVESNLQNCVNADYPDEL